MLMVIKYFSNNYCYIPENANNTGVQVRAINYTYGSWLTCHWLTKTHVSFGMKNPFSDVSLVVLEKIKISDQAIHITVAFCFTTNRLLITSLKCYSYFHNTFRHIVSGFDLLFDETYQWGMVKGTKEEWRKTSVMKASRKGRLDLSERRGGATHPHIFS